MKSRFRGIQGILFSMLVWGCTVPPLSRTAYESVEKPDELRSVRFVLPEVKPLAETPQMQKKGDVVVSVEIVPFEVIKSTTREERIVATDDPDFDNYEIAKIPSITTQPAMLSFRIRVKNGQDRVLKLDEVPIDFKVDGINNSVDGTNYVEWKQGMILPGSEKEYTVAGPQLATLPDSCVVGIFLFDMPTAYSKAGVVTSKDNYKWYFKFVKRVTDQEAMVAYSYEKRPTYKEVCSQCQGAGSYLGTCSGCGGSGKAKNLSGAVVNHLTCNGTGKVSKDCPGCVGGKIAHRKSGDAVVDERWTGYHVNILTKPAGVQVWVVNPDTKEYVHAGESNRAVDWWVTCSKHPTKKYPIRLVYGGKTLELLAINAKNLPIATLQVDFSGAEPVVIKGTRAPSIQ